MTSGVGDEGRASRIKCFVVGCSRSGTTLLSVLLDRHSALAVPPETGFYPEIAARLVGGEILSEILKTWPRLPELLFTSEALLARCGERPSPPVLLECMLGLYADAVSKVFCGEKTPAHWRYVSSLLADFPRSKIIFLVRDGRDTALSLRSMPWWDKDLESAASVWVGAARAARHASVYAPERVKVAKYEDLVASPRRELEALMAFIGLDFETAQLDVGVPSRVVMARSLAWKGRALEPVDSTRVGGWRRHGNCAEVDFLNNKMRTELDAFGYP